MTRDFFFGDAKWIGASNSTADTFSVLRGRFTAQSINEINLNILGLGFFKCFINGKCINPDTFLPLSSEYEPKAMPSGEEFCDSRTYVESFDITPFVTLGENVIAIHFGGGWYTDHDRVFGLPKAIYRIAVHEDDKINYFVSDESCKVGNSFVDEYNFIQFEAHNYVDFTDCFGLNFDDSNWENAVLAEEPETNYCTTVCPRDAVIRKLSPCEIKKEADGVIYDCGQNISGYPVIEIHAKAGEEVTVLFSEEVLPGGELDLSHGHKQRFSVISDGTVKTVQPEFTWYGFRYFKVFGNATPLSVHVVHANVPVSSSFESDNETLNWIYNTFINTMLSNMHTGHPSDCPHLERRGYTGDGQLTCHAALSVFDGEAFYEKWLQDIADSQDKLSGHIQYTAPYLHSGGGPGGWGCAIVEVPYQMYKHYGRRDLLEKYYPNMRRYIDYLEAHSEFGLVTSDRAWEWCLGDWCGPNILYPEKDITSHNQQVVIPAPMVNTYFMAKSLMCMSEIAHIIGKDDDVEEYTQKADRCKRVIRAAYFNAFDDNFIMNVQGANAFGVDLGLGSEKTYEKMVQYYKKLGNYDTGIFATDIVTRLLFERGDGELAFNLLVNNGDQGFEHWRRNGATTFHEYWDSNRSRSHNHPMFGAVVAYFFEYLLGIRQQKDSAGYSSVVIKPEPLSGIGKMSGSMTTPNGVIAVSYEKKNDAVIFNISIPEGTEAEFEYADEKCALKSGENQITTKLYKRH